MPRPPLVALVPGFLALAVCLATAQGRVTAPAEHLGRPLAADFALADWGEVRTYFERLDRESPRVVLEKVGTTSEGRDFVLATISSEANLARLAELTEHARLLADPRGASEQAKRAAVEQGRVFLFVTSAMHATEAAGPQFSMALAHALATSDEEPWRSAREHCVVLLVPSLNPDGQDHVVEWYRRTVGTPYEASELTKLYQLYSGHDNNRDWFMLTQAETRIVTRLLYQVWRPQVYWDVHQQGSRAERMFVPPFRDPLDPNLDAGVVSGINALGTRALFDLTAEGKRGVSTGGTYDMWWNGGNRNVPVRHNIVGLLTEAASVRIASPVFLPPDELRPPSGLPEYAPSNRFPDPWPGGWWRLADIVDYELAFARSLLGSLSRERSTWLANALGASERAIARGREGAPTGWILPADAEDVGAARRLAEVLVLSGVELDVAAREIVADGRSYPAGSIVIARDQPYGRHVEDLFEIQRYPGAETPYDVAGWTLPLLLGVRRVEVVGELDRSALRRASGADDALAAFAGRARPKDAPGAMWSGDSDAWRELFRPGAHTLVRSGEHAGWAARGELALGEEPQRAAFDGPPRIGLYAPWSGSMDEGWTRWVLDEFGVPYVTVRNEMLRAGELGDFLDVLLLPGVGPEELDRGRAEGSVFDAYSGGLDPEGAVAVEEFVRRGGTLVAVGASAAWAIELLRLPLVDVARGDDAKGFSCPGSVLRAIPEPGPWAAGLPDSLAVFFARSSAWREMTAKEREDARLEKAPAGSPEVLARYAPTRLLLSGWIAKPETIAGHAAWVRAEHGAGAVHLFGFRPQYRGWAQNTFHLLFRALWCERRG